MKKFLSLLLAAMIVLSMGVAAFAVEHKGTDTRTKVLAKEATCTESGNIEYYECSCGAFFANATSNEKLKATDVLTNPLGELEHHEAVEATCTEGGNVEYWECTGCGKYFNAENHVATAEVKATDVLTNPLGELEHHEAVEATCTESGNVEYWECTNCGKYFNAENHVATSEVKATNVFTNPIGHEDDDGDGFCDRCCEPMLCHYNFDNVTFHEGKSATCLEDGVADYWDCKECHKLFSNATCTEEIEEPEVISALGHIDENEDYVCDRCGAELEKPAEPEIPTEPEKPSHPHYNDTQTIVIGGKEDNRNEENPNTGAPAAVAVISAAAVLAGAGVIASKKRK